MILHHDKDSLSKLLWQSLNILKQMNFILAITHNFHLLMADLKQFHFSHNYVFFPLMAFYN